MRTPTPWHWWSIVVAALAIVVMWPPADGKSLAVTFVNWAVDPTDQLPVLPPQLPLAPSIAPELVTTHLRTAAIIDNLNMMQAVLTDVLIHPKADDVRAELDQVIAQFTDRHHRVVDVDDWIRMALRHSIFEQGGPALGVMTVSDRNTSGHLQHLGGRGILPGMK